MVKIMIKTVKGSKDMKEINLSKVNNIISVWEDGILVVKVSTSDGDLYQFPTLTAMQIHTCNEFLRTLDLIPGEFIFFKNHRQYENSIDCFHTLLEIKNVLVTEGIKEDAFDVYRIMLDGFKGKNMVKKAEQEHNLKKYVHLALNKFDSFYGKVGE